MFEILTRTFFFSFERRGKRGKSKWNIFGAPPFFVKREKKYFVRRKKSSNGLRITDWIKVNPVFYSLKTRKDFSSY